MQYKTVSIIIPIYQAEDYIERCIASVISQTYSHSNIECILIDDCGTDRSIMLAQKCIDNYKGSIQFVLIHNDYNCGLSVSRNNGMRVANGDYLFFLDSDDYISADCIEKFMNTIYEHPEVEVVKGNYIDKHFNNKNALSHLSSRLIDNKELMKLFFLEFIPCMAWNTLISRELIERLHLTFAPDLLHEDELWSFYLFKDTNSFILIPDITLIYEVNPHSIISTEQKNEELHIRSIIFILTNFQSHIEKRYYEGIIIYMVSMILRLMDRIKQSPNEKGLLSDIMAIRNRISTRTLADFRLILFAFSFIMYQPFINIFRIKYFRKKYHKFTCYIYTLASFFSPIHSLTHHMMHKAKNENGNKS